MLGLLYAFVTKCFVSFHIEECQLFLLLTLFYLVFWFKLFILRIPSQYFWSELIKAIIFEIGYNIIFKNSWQFLKINMAGFLIQSVDQLFNGQQFVLILLLVWIRHLSSSGGTTNAHFNNNNVYINFDIFYKY